jgi:magnesium transporter
MVSVAAAYIYAKGRRMREVDLADPHSLDMARGEFAWIGMVEPSEEELRILQQRFDLHPLAVEDALTAHQIPKVEIYDNQLFVVARTAHLEQGELVYGETDIFVGRNHIITVRHGSARAHTELRKRLETASGMLRNGSDYVLHAVLDYIVDGYLPIVEAIEDEIEAMERRALNSFLHREQVARLFGLRREMMKFRRMLVFMEEVAARLEHQEFPCIDLDIQPYFRDVRDHVRRVASMVEAQRDVLSSVFEVSALLEQQAQGEITRKLAAWAAILAVPTAIAGIYGMNFEHMPELHWHYGYYVVLGVIVVLCGGLYAWFRRVKWL